MNSCSLTPSHIAEQPNPKLPSLASMRDRNAPPGRKSFVATGVCQSADALFHSLICFGVVHNSQTFSTGASIVVFMMMGDVILRGFYLMVCCCSLFTV